MSSLLAIGVIIGVIGAFFYYRQHASGVRMKIIHMPEFQTPLHSTKEPEARIVDTPAEGHFVQRQNIRPDQRKPAEHLKERHTTATERGSRTLLGRQCGIVGNFTRRQRQARKDRAIRAGIDYYRLRDDLRGKHPLRNQLLR
jgi:hypothetical protein